MHAACTALGLEDAHQREVVPLLRRGAAAASFPGYAARPPRVRDRRPPAAL